MVCSPRPCAVERVPQHESHHANVAKVLARRLRLAGDFDFKLIAQRTPGFVGADLQALTKEAAAIAIKRIFSQLGALVPPSAAPEDLMDAKAVRIAGRGCVTCTHCGPHVQHENPHLVVQLP